MRIITTIKITIIKCVLLVSSLLGAAEYQLGPDDEVEIYVFQESELTTKAQISQAGNISLPLVGQVPLEGLTAKQAKSKIEDMYRDGYLVNPNITIIVRQYRPFLYTAK
ncbi:polysaccharide biosynthesis/export family protein [Psychrosphaera algicola]|uniref:Polysaccharide biosynthesis/export family protein n=1 Tax=Psychrosphaera algicola TaxID=3023714 RepID=A0ABT5FC83_9GAMM|nr:polysaccharide biosynthesis/export family protein [Psychrosphaera sp. G1-22]MDC2888754.1 polysaccharide biosynthesis/export family protein [Psychrosphaera sp. G1-22]